MRFTAKLPDPSMTSWADAERFTQMRSVGGVVLTELTAVAMRPARLPS